jgi:hypothetical protein
VGDVVHDPVVVDCDCGACGGRELPGVIQQAEAKTAQVLEGVERRARKRAHDAEHGEKEL